MNPRAGFSLIEVMFSLILLGAALTVLLTTLGESNVMLRKAGDYETVRSLFEVLKLTEPLQIDELEEGSDSGSFDAPYNRYTWTRDIVAIGKEEDKFFHITTTISWGDAQNRGSESTETYLHQPSAQRDGWIKDDVMGEFSFQSP